MQRRSTGYLISLTVMWAALTFHWTVLGNNIIPTRVLAFAGDAAKGTMLGLVTVAGALVAMITGPIAGVLSDESRSRYGRRRPFLTAGILCNAVALVALVGTSSFAGFLLASLAVQLFANMAGSPYSAIIPDQVPDLQKGKATGFAGVAEVAGRLLGAIVGGLLVSLPAVAAVLAPALFFLPRAWAERPMMPLALLTGLITVAALIFTLVRVQENSPDFPADRIGHLLRRAFVFDFRGESSFAWLLAARGFNMLGINTITTFLLYYIHDYLGVHDLGEANAKVGYLFAVSSLTTLPSALLIGYLIDRHQRRKLWVYVSSAGLALVCVGLIAVRHFTDTLLIGVLFGACYGIYFTSDWALALVLLPQNDSAAKYMGIWNIAGTFPQVIAPGIGGVLLDRFNAIAPNLGYPVVFGTVVVYLVVGTAMLLKVVEPAAALAPAAQEPAASPT
jgi:MFS family permease